MILRAALTWLVLALPLAAQQAPDAPPRPEQIVAGMSRDDVDITTNFDGSDIIIYGAIKRETQRVMQNTGMGGLTTPSTLQRYSAKE